MDAYTKPAIYNKKLKAREAIASASEESEEDEDVEEPTENLSDSEGGETHNASLRSESKTSLVTPIPRQASASPTIDDDGLRRSTRHVGSNARSLLYNTGYHPADEVLRPKAAATHRQRSQQKPTRWMSKRNDPIETQLVSVVVERRSPAKTKLTKEMDHTGVGSLSKADMLQPHPLRSSITKSVPVSDPAIVFEDESLPELVLSSDQPTVSMPDESALTGSMSRRTSPFRESDMPVQKYETGQSPSKWSIFHQPYPNHANLEWNSLEDLDRVTYILQNGAPAEGSTLPLSWQAVKEGLFEEGYITSDDIADPEFTLWLVKRYESIRLRLQEFFQAKPEPATNKGWTVFWAEGLDTYDKPPGRKYFRHYKDSIVETVHTSVDGSARGQDNVVGASTKFTDVVDANPPTASFTKSHEMMSMRGCSQPATEHESPQLSLSQSEANVLENMGFGTSTGAIAQGGSLTARLHNQPSSFGASLPSASPKILPAVVDLPVLTHEAIPARWHAINKRPVALSLIDVHEDAPGSTPTPSRGRASPGTDALKENQDPQDEAESSSDLAGSQTSQPQRQRGLDGTPRRRHRRSIFGGD